MAQDIHVTSTAIASIQRNLTEKVLPALRRLKQEIGSTDVGFPGFGTLGLVMIGQYSHTQDDVRRYIDEAIDTVLEWIKALETIKTNWLKAELNSTVVYR
ncbi:hypothetical protein AB0B45_22105 [Nonomuraea sp. NPDC049152]|uniref:hypothetical protein n=1 Tax=Nonomuraea sp. NPDC049152 TaxID=3154350 RepID=UPI0033CAF008